MKQRTLIITVAIAAGAIAGCLIAAATFTPILPRILGG